MQEARTTSKPGLFPLNRYHRESGIAGFVWSFIWGPLNVILSFAPLAVLNFCQMLGVVIWPFSRQAFRRYQRGIAYAVWGWWGFAVQKICGLKVVVTGDDISRPENAIVICNHQEMSDIIVILCHAYNIGTVKRTTWMAKDVLKYIPGLGWGMAFLDTVFLKRNWSRDEAGIKATFARIISNNLPVWMISFPEGTRVTPAKLAKSNEFARMRQLPPTKHVILPRATGFYATVTGLRSHVTAVYSLTIGYHGRVPKLTEIIRGDVKEVGLHIRRFPIDQIPADRSEISAWLMKEFQFKDRLLTEFKSRGCFPDQPSI
jgi:1-acyl-sn-glycerol-3-phosphate acyltransferase